MIHPRDLNLVFLAYTGGVILSDLTQRSSVHAYELVLPPGAPGGTGYGTEDIFEHRRPEVTAIAVHPTGHFFAVGHSDGSIAFWAVDDQEKPLLVRTIETVDVNIVDADGLETYLVGRKANSSKSIREPIFKLSWSGFSNSADLRGGDTVLTILGGLLTDTSPGLTTLLLPPFQPSEPPPGPPTALHPHFRDAMCRSIEPTKSFFYRTSGVVQDYLLIPTSSPHFSGSFDPYAIIFLVDSVGSTRATEGYLFPPSGFFTRDASSSDQVESRAIEQRQDVHTLRLPLSLSNGNAGILGGRLISLEKDVYHLFIGDRLVDEQNLLLKGGRAFADQTKQNELRLSKYQPPRILMTYHLNLKVQFFDVSAQLLVSSGTDPLQNHFPDAIPTMTIDLSDVVSNAIGDRIFFPDEETSIHSVEVAPEALEFAVVLEKGDVVVYRSSPTLPNVANIPDSEITPLKQVVPHPEKRLSPYFLIPARKGNVKACALSDIGFLAVSYSEGSLLILDMRGPRIIHSAVGKKHKTKPTIGLSGVSHHASHFDVVTSLVWTIAPLTRDFETRVRLIASYSSGDSEVFTLAPSGNPVSWKVSGEPITIKGIWDPIYSVVIDSKTGALQKPNPARLAASLRPTPEDNSHSFFLVVGKKGARCVTDIDGDRIGKAEWPHKAGVTQVAQLVEHMGSRALVVVTEKNEVLTYSLPQLEHLHGFQHSLTSSPLLTIDESGDFVSWVRSPTSGVIDSATYGSLFDIRRLHAPADLDFSNINRNLAAQPQPVSLGPVSLMGSWFKTSQALTGAQIDDLLGGPDRPTPKKPQDRAVTGDAAMSVEAGVASIAGAAAAAQANIYNRLTSALGERGQLLGNLEESFSALEAGSKSMVAQAKRLATQQTTKSWFGL